MKWFFDMDNPVMSALSVMADLLVLNLLALLCSLPLVTAGAAFTALSSVCIRLVRREDRSLVKDYFRDFKANFKKSTLLWLILVAAAALLYFDYLAALAYVPPLRVGIFAIALILLAVAFYGFGLLSRYETALWPTLKNAVKLMIGFFPLTLLMLVFSVCFWLLCVRFFKFGSLVLLLLGLSLPAYVNAILLNSMFQKIEK